RSAALRLSLSLPTRRSSDLLFLLSFLSSAAASQTGWQGQLVAYLGLPEHMRDFAHGVVDSRPVILSLTLTAFFLFLSWKTVESRSEEHTSELQSRVDLVCRL